MGKRKTKQGERQNHVIIYLIIACQLKTNDNKPITITIIIVIIIKVSLPLSVGETDYLNVFM